MQNNDLMLIINIKVVIKSNVNLIVVNKYQQMSIKTVKNKFVSKIFFFYNNNRCYSFISNHTSCCSLINFYESPA